MRVSSVRVAAVSLTLQTLPFMVCMPAQSLACTGPWGWTRLSFSPLSLLFGGGMQATGVFPAGGCEAPAPLSWHRPFCSTVVPHKQLAAKVFHKHVPLPCMYARPPQPAEAQSQIRF